MKVAMPGLFWIFSIRRGTVTQKIVCIVCSLPCPIKQLLQNQAVAVLPPQPIREHCESVSADVLS